MSSDAIDDIITKAETKKTKESTKWAIRVFEGEFFYFRNIINTIWKPRKRCALFATIFRKNDWNKRMNLLAHTRLQPTTTYFSQKRTLKHK